MDAKWSEHSFTCQACGRTARIRADYWQQAKTDTLRNHDPEATDVEIAGCFEECLSCVGGEEVEGEHAYRPDYANAILRRMR